MYSVKNFDKAKLEISCYTIYLILLIKPRGMKKKTLYVSITIKMSKTRSISPLDTPLWPVSAEENIGIPPTPNGTKTNIVYYQGCEKKERSHRSKSDKFLPHNQGCHTRIYYRLLEIFVQVWLFY